MAAIKDKKIVVAVSGSIATYKSLLLVRLLIKEGAYVKVIMTEAATKFVSPLSFSTLANSDTKIDFFEENVWNNHVEMGLWADLIVVCPATANTLGKCANGICDNLVVATYLSAKCPVVFCPAMDLDMYKHPSTLANLITLKSYGNHLIEAPYGELVSGLVGEGRLEEPENIVVWIEKFFTPINQSLLNYKFVITAGPTYEALDPVRFIGNHSSGKMGLALADTISNYGGSVDLVIGPNNLVKTNKPFRIHEITSGLEMYEVVTKLHEEANVVIFAAAVADYRPASVAAQKIKKSTDSFTIEIVKNVDIALELGKKKRSGQIHVGFALETENEETNAKVKIEKKNFDFIVLNSLNDKGAGFKHDTNKIKIINRLGVITEYTTKSKHEVAEDIILEIIKTLHSK